MDWGARVYNYCERGADPGFWAEPFNALSNIGFVVVAAAGVVIVAGQPGGLRGKPWAVVLSGLVGVVGIGSFLFHTFATRWAAVADVGPIGLFMLAYLVCVLRVLFGLSWVWVGVGVAAFVGSMPAFSVLFCPHSAMPVTAVGRAPCFNGSISYVPAVVALVLAGGGLAVRRRAAGVYLLAAAAVFSASLALRTLDLELCSWTTMLGRPRGTHALWHGLNAVTLLILLSAVIRHGGSATGRQR